MSRPSPRSAVRAARRNVLALRWDQRHGFDLHQNVLAHQIGFEASADRQRVAEIFRSDSIHSFVVGWILQHNDDFKDVIHRSTDGFDALAYIVQRQARLLLDRVRQFTIVVIAADMTQRGRARDVQLISYENRPRKRADGLGHTGGLDDGLIHCWLR